jgi:chromosome partitioning protein
MDAGIPVFNAFVRLYKVHERAPLEGVPITQAKGKNAKEAASDYQRVADELLRKWGNR